MSNKIVLGVTVFIMLFSFTNCDKVDELTKFNMDYQTEVVIPSSTGVSLPFNVISPEVETDSEAEFAINDTRKDLIEDIRLRELNLRIKAPEGEDFSFLESLTIYISAEGLEETEVAFISDIPESVGDVLDLETVDVDIQEYIKADSFSLRLNTVTDEILTSDHTLEVNAVFFVDAKILGI